MSAAIAGPAAAATAGFCARFWDVEDGLPQSSVTDITQTADGFVWVGTLHSGLARFDGSRFECFDLDNKPQLGHSGVRRLFRDRIGRLWVHTYGPGLLVFENHDFHPVARQCPQLEGLVEATRDRVVFATLGNHLEQYERAADGKWISRSVKNQPGLPVSHWAAGMDGIWFRRDDGSIGRYQDGRMNDTPFVPGLGTVTVDTLLPGDETVFVTSGSRIGRWNGDIFEDITPPDLEEAGGKVQITPVGKTGLWIQHGGRMRLLHEGGWVAECRDWNPAIHDYPNRRGIRSHPDGSVWIVSSDSTLYHLGPDGSLSRIDRKDGPVPTAISSMLAGDDDSLWTGHTRGGLGNIRRSLFRTLQRADGLAETPVSSVCADAAGSLWISSASGTLYEWKDGAMIRHQLPRLSHRCLTPLLVSSPDGRLWIATDGNGLLVRENGAFRHVLRPEDLKSPPRAILADRHGHIWIATFAGIYRYSSAGIELLEATRGAGDYPGAMAESPDGSVWVGTLGGCLKRFKDGKSERTPLPGTGPRNFISALLADADGSLWIGTQGGGLLHWNGREFKRFTRTNGLPENRVWQLLDDGLGGIWLGPGTGFSRIDKSALLAGDPNGRSVEVRRFGTGDGVRGASGTPDFKPSCCVAPDGHLWFATARGVVGVHPGSLTATPRPPRTLVRGILANAMTMSPAESIRIGPGNRSLEFAFTAPEFRHPELIRFRHQMLGLDDSWLDAGADRIATYRHMPPGDYIFEVVASNSAGRWSTTPARVKVIVTPHFWETLWFRLLCLLAAGAAVVGIVRYVSFRRLRRRLAAFEQEAALQQERARISKDIHDDVGASLTEIALLSELAGRRIHEPTHAREHINRIFERARSVTRAIDDIVWSFNPENDTVEGMVLHLGRMAPEFLGAAGIRCRTDFPIELPDDPLPSRVRHNLYLAVKECLHNIVKHSGASEVWIRVQTTPSHLTIRIEDNGCGYQAGGVHAAGADGLRNIALRMQDVGGDSASRPLSPRGTQTVLSVPTRRKSP